MQRRLRIAILGILAILGMPPVLAEDWPQWMGVRRDGTWQDTQTLTRFPKNGLRVHWAKPIGAGFAGPAVAGGKVFVTDFDMTSGALTNQASGKDRVSGRERLSVFDEASGTQLWRYDYDLAVEVSYASGPRTTPLVHGDQVFILGTAGHLAALHVETGRLIWSLDLPKAYATNVPMWGYSGHLLLANDLVIAMPGGKGSTVVALDAKTGQERWRALDAVDPGYCPPTLVTRQGKHQLLIWHPEALNGLEASSGRLLWSIPLKAKYGMSVTAPQFSENRMFVSGIGTVPTAFAWEPEQLSPRIAWQAFDGRSLKTGNSTPILDEDILYGIDTRGYLAAVDLQTGNRLWSTLAPTTGSRPARYATAFLIKNHDHYYLFNELGTLISAQLSEDGYLELDRTQLIEPTLHTYGRKVVWSHPAFANGSIIVRNDREIIRYDLRQTKTTPTPRQPPSTKLK